MDQILKTRVLLHINKTRITLENYKISLLLKQILSFKAMEAKKEKK